MNRKHFISSLTLGGMAATGFGNLPGRVSGAERVLEEPPRMPPYLKPGDTIGITCPAGCITEEEILPAIQQIRSWGFLVKLGETVGKKDFTFGGTDEERAGDFQHMLDDKDIRAILCARGGYGSVRIIDRLNFSRFVRHPKWIIGFSDVTVLHAHLNRNFGVASIHSKMCNSFPADWSLADPVQVDSILSIRQALSGEPINYPVLPNAANRSGQAEGILVGGNLKTLETLAGSVSDLRTEGKILFVEDTGEYLYSIDRMFWSLKRSGKLNKLAGLVVGGFRVKPDDPGEEFGHTVPEIVMDHVREYRYPLCFDFPVGHQKNNFALVCGARHRLLVNDQQCRLTELR